MALTSDAQTIDLTSKVVNLLIKQGDTKSFTVTFPDAISLTSSTAKMTIKRRGGTTVLTLQSGSGITRSGQVFTTSFTKAQTAALPVDVLLDYDWQWTDASGTEDTVIGGTIQVKKQTTTT